MNFLSEPATTGGEGRRIYTKVFEMPSVPRAFEHISDVTFSGKDLDVLPGTVTKVTWTFAVDEWIAYVDVQTAVAYDDQTHDPSA